MTQVAGWEAQQTHPAEPWVNLDDFPCSGLLNPEDRSLNDISLEYTYEELKEVGKHGVVWLNISVSPSWTSFLDSITALQLATCV